MNAHAKKKARRAELEWVLLAEWADSQTLRFADWLEQRSKDFSYILRDEVIGLIALYEEGL